MTRNSIAGPLLLGLVLLANLVLASAGPAWGAGDPVRLKDKIVAAGPDVTLGDIFDGAGAAAGVVIARSPEPGRRLILSSRALARFAAANGLNWKARRGSRTVTIGRASQPVPEDSVRDALLSALSEVSDLIEPDIEFVPRRLSILVALDQSPSVAIADLRFDRDRLRFSADLMVPADAENPRRIRVTGRLYPMQEIVVPIRQIRPGEIVTENDVDYRRLRRTKIGRNVISDPQELVGMSARRTLRTGRPIRRGDVIRPQVIAKGSINRMLFQTDRLTLTATGRALQAGGMGDVIRLVNIYTKQTIEAVVIGPGRVHVDPTGAQYAATAVR